MKYEWDEDKNQQNISKHGVSFHDACKIFDEITVDALDDRHDYGETRTISIGVLKNVAILVVVHTDRNGKCRIMSARPANKKERRHYDEAIRKTSNR